MQETSIYEQLEQSLQEDIDHQNEMNSITSNKSISQKPSNDGVANTEIARQEDQSNNSTHRQADTSPLEQSAEIKFGRIPQRDLKKATKIPASLVNYFENKDSRQEFLQNEFFTERNQLPPQCKANRKAFRIYLKGAVNHVKALEQEVENVKMWKPRQNKITLKIEDTNTYKMTKTRLKPQEVKFKVQSPRTTGDNFLVREKGCQVSGRFITVPQKLSYNVKPEVNNVNEIQSLIYDNIPIIQQRQKGFNSMINSKDIKTKFDITKVSFSNQYLRKQDIVIDTKSLTETSNQRYDFQVTNSHKIASPRAMKFSSLQMFKVPQSMVPTEANIQTLSLASIQVRVKKYYEKICGHT